MGGMPDGKSIVFIDEDEKGNWRLFAQDFVPGKDTTDSRRPIGGLDVDRKIDTFTISPDSSKIVMAEVEVLSSLIMAEGIPGIEPQHK
jgi:eukaryotic-like serine/threonine-protein kinase